MDVWRANRRVEYQIRRKSPSLDVWASHQSRHDEPQKPMRKRQARNKNSLKCKMLPFEGRIGRDGHRNRVGSSNAWHEFEDLERIPVSRLEAFYRAATFIFLSCERLRVSDDSADCDGVSVLPNWLRKSRARGPHCLRL